MLSRAVLPALLAATGCASSPRLTVETETVEAEGWAPVDPKDAAGTRQRALAEAQRRAVEKAAGLALIAFTKVDAAITVQQRITAELRGTIRSYDILWEKSEAGLLRIGIRAVVLRRKQGADAAWDRVQAEPPPGSPPLLLAVQGSGPQSAAWSASATSAARTKLLARGFALADPRQTRETRPHLMVRGEASAYRVADSRLGPFVSYRATVRLELIEPETGTVIWDQSREASALGENPDSASSMAFENAGTLAGSALAEDLAAYLWRRQ